MLTRLQTKQGKSATNKKKDEILIYFEIMNRF